MKTNAMHHLTILFLLLATAVTVSSQSKTLQISGIVSDMVTGDGVDNVTVYITDLESGVTDSTMTNGAGFWQYDLVTSVARGPLQPTEFRVTQNYPNPFNPATRIELSMPQAAEVKVTVFNILGEVIDSHTQFLTTGIHTIDWHARGAAGIYFINFKTDNKSVTRKMTLQDGGHGDGLSGFRSGSKQSANLSKLSAISAAISVKLETSKFGYLPHTVETEVEGGEMFDFKIETIHNTLLLMDMHNDVLEVMARDTSYHLADRHNFNHTDIPRMQLGGVDVQFFSMWVNPSTHGHASFDRAMEMVDIFNAELALNPTTLGQARTKAEALALTQENKIAGVLAVEGGHAIENDLGKLIALYEAGVRYLTITWNNSTDWAVSAQDNRSATVGLSDFGRQVIRTMDSLGVIIDVSHTGIKTIEDILTVTENPIIATHSGVRALRDHYRNLYDHQIEAIANTGGVIGVVFYPPFLSPRNAANIATVADHIDYIVDLVGINHVGIGSDFDGIGTNTVSGLWDVTRFPYLTFELLERGYSGADLEKILGGNFMRVFGEVSGE